MILTMIGEERIGMVIRLKFPWGADSRAGEEGLVNQKDIDIS
jgi:hypothetical protein